MSSPTEHYPVLIIGGGPTGLTLAALLARQGVRCMVAESDPGTCDHPQAHVINRRTDEIFQNLGISEAMHAAVDPAALGGVKVLDSLSGQVFARLRGGPPPAEFLRQRALESPAPGTSCPQDEVEPLLLRCAMKHGAEVRFRARLQTLEQDPDGVTATLDTPAGNREIRCDWLIGCDGAGSTTRRAAQIEMTGPEPFAHIVGIYVAADLAPYMRDGPGMLHWTLHPEQPVTMITMGHGRWTIQAGYDGTPEGAARFDTDYCRGIVDSLAGAPVADAEIRSVKPWAMGGQVAATYRNGRVLLAGDAAHRFPPTGGYGLNTGVQDAQNLAWKLSAVVQGRSTMDLLETYEQERRPIAESNCEFSVRNAFGMAPMMGPGAIRQAQRLANGEVTPTELAQELQAVLDQEAAHFGAPGRELGFTYDKGALLPDGTEPAPFDDAHYVPSARPGARAPHVWLRRGDSEISILELFGDHFTLLTNNNASDWPAACASARTPVQCFVIGTEPEDPDALFAEAYGVHGGAVLVRPDGHVAWRQVHPVADPRATLEQTLKVLLGDPQ